MQIQQQHNFSGLLSKEMVVYIMALNPLNILLSEAAPLIYDNHKTTDYYWTNFSDIKKKNLQAFFFQIFQRVTKGLGVSSPRINKSSCQEHTLLTQPLLISMSDFK